MSKKITITSVCFALLAVASVLIWRFAFYENYIVYSSEKYGIGFSYPEVWGAVVEREEVVEFTIKRELYFEEMPSVALIMQTGSMPDVDSQYRDAIYYSSQEWPRSPTEFCASLSKRCSNIKFDSLESCDRRVFNMCGENPPQKTVMEKIKKGVVEYRNSLARQDDPLKNSKYEVSINKHYYFALKGDVFNTLTIRRNIANIEVNPLCPTYEGSDPTCILPITADETTEQIVSAAAKDGISKNLSKLIASLEISETENQSQEVTEKLRTENKLKQVDGSKLSGLIDIDELTPKKLLEVEQVAKFITGKVDQVVGSEGIPISLVVKNEAYKDLCNQNRDGLFLDVSKEEVQAIPIELSDKEPMDEFLFAQLKIHGARDGHFSSSDMEPILEFSAINNDLKVPPPVHGWACNADIDIYYYGPDRIVVDMGQGFETSNYISLWYGDKWESIYNFLPISNPVKMGPANEDYFTVMETKGCCSIYHPTVPGHWADFIFNKRTLGIVDVKFRSSP